MGLILVLCTWRAKRIASNSSRVGSFGSVFAFAVISRDLFEPVSAAYASLNSYRLHTVVTALFLYWQGTRAKSLLKPSSPT